MRFRVSIMDLTVAIVVLVVLVLPGRSFSVGQAYEASDVQARDIALAQARLATNPGDADAAAKLARLLTTTGQTDWAVQVAAAAVKPAGIMGWRPLLAVSEAYIERRDVNDAHRFAQEALAACRTAGPGSCPVDIAVRMQIYFDQLQAGVSSGIDPRTSPREYEQAVMSRLRSGILRFNGAPDEAGEPAEPQDPDAPQQGDESDTPPPETKSGQ